jgi:thioredoxin 1
MMILTAEKYKTEVLKSKTPVLVDFYADWCGPCRMLGPVLEELSNDPDFKGNLQFAKINTEEYPELAQENNVQGIPCLIIFKNGKEANRIVGFAPKAVMKAKINSVLAGL